MSRGNDFGCIDRKLRKQLKDAGCTLLRSKSNHIKVYYQGRLVSVLAVSASDHRSLKNFIGELRKQGIELS